MGYNDTWGPERTSFRMPGMLSNQDIQRILADTSKRVEGDIRWSDDEDRSVNRVFRAKVKSDSGYSLEVRGRFNHQAGFLTYLLILKGQGRIYSLDIGQEHHNPDCNRVGEKHKHMWCEEFGDKQAYEPEDITAMWNDPVEVWQQFCREANLTHQGTMYPPHIQRELDL